MELPAKRTKTGDVQEERDMTSNNSQQPRESHNHKPKGRQNSRRADWDVTGRYSLQCTSRYQPVDASEYLLDLYYEHDSPHTCMLFAFFRFPNLGLSDGVMRLCPRQALDESGHEGCQRLYSDEFTAACVLADRVRPGPKAKEWLMRWCARHVSGDNTVEANSVGGYERAQGQFVFKKDSGTGNMHITFPIIHKGKHILFEGTKVDSLHNDKENIGDAYPSPPNANDTDPVAKAKLGWDRLYNPVWDMRPLSDTDIEEQDTSEYLPGKGHNHWERPRTGALIYAKNKPGPNPGFRANEDLSSKVIEERPSWAWDVTGKWIVHSPEFNAIVNGPDIIREKSEPPPPLEMKIWLENNPWHTKVGRQLWAEFKFGDTWGNMRFCPASVAAANARAGKYSIAAFENSCILEPGMWPGYKGAVEWGLRWRGYNPYMGLLDGDTGETTTLKFTRDPVTEQLSLSGTLIYGVERMMFIGEKSSLDGGAERSGQAVTVTRAWKQYQPRAISLEEYADFEEPE